MGFNVRSLRPINAMFLQPAIRRYGSELHRVIFLLLFLISHALTAQTNSVSSDFIGVSYFSEGGFYPGFTINFERTLLANKRFEILAAARAGAYFHYRNHTGTFLMIQSGQRIRLYRQLYFEHYLGLGYLHSFLNGGDPYYVDAAGMIHKKSNSGSPHFMPSVSFGLSYVIAVSERQMRLFGRPMIFWLIPFNKTSLVQYGLEVGAIVNIKR